MGVYTYDDNSRIVGFLGETEREGYRGEDVKPASLVVPITIATIKVDTIVILKSFSRNPACGGMVGIVIVLGIKCPDVNVACFLSSKDFLVESEFSTILGPLFRPKEFSGAVAPILDLTDRKSVV